jgi:hypothetical protein
MKTLTTLLATTVIASFSISANAGDLTGSGQIGMNDVSQESSYPADFRHAIEKQDITFVQGDEPWRIDNENTFNKSTITTAGMLQEMESNPTASGNNSEAFWDAVLNEY